MPKTTTSKSSGTAPGAAKKAPAKKAPAKKAPAKKAPAKKAPAKKAPAKKAPAKKAPAKKAPAKKAPATRSAASGSTAAASRNPQGGHASTKGPAANKSSLGLASNAQKPPAKPAPTDAGFDKAFLAEVRGLLLEERATLLHQSEVLRAEADSLAMEISHEVQFDEESGEGGTIAIERERDLVLSSQARQVVESIDEALLRLDGGRFGMCETCGKPLTKMRLRAMPRATECVECKSASPLRR